MRLEDKSANEPPFFKFDGIGDNITGTFVSYTEGIPGKYGPESHLVLEREDGTQICIRCSVNLARQISENVPAIKGKSLRIELSGERPTAKGSPMKLFSVDVDEPGAHRPTESAATDDPLPF